MANILGKARQVWIRTILVNEMTRAILDQNKVVDDVSLLLAEAEQAFKNGNPIRGRSKLWGAEMLVTGLKVGTMEDGKNYFSERIEKLNEKYCSPSQPPRTPTEPSYPA